MKQLLLEKISLLSPIFPETFFCDHQYIYQVPNDNVYLIKRPISQPRNIANILFSTRTLCLDCTFKIKTMVNMCKLQQAQFATLVTLFVEVVTFKPKIAGGWYHTPFDAHCSRIETSIHT